MTTLHIQFHVDALRIVFLHYTSRVSFRDPVMTVQIQIRSVRDLLMKRKDGVSILLQRLDKNIWPTGENMKKVVSSSTVLNNEKCIECVETLAFVSLNEPKAHCLAIFCPKVIKCEKCHPLHVRNGHIFSLPLSLADEGFFHL